MRLGLTFTGIASVDRPVRTGEHGKSARTGKSHADSAVLAGTGAGKT